MNDAILNIIDSNAATQDKLKALNILEEQIHVAKQIIDGKYKYCPECKDYYLEKSFLTEKETKETKVCVYVDPINSSGDQYVDGFVDITYSICPKNHKYEINRNERTY